MSVVAFALLLVVVPIITIITIVIVTIIIVDTIAITNVSSGGMTTCQVPFIEKSTAAAAINPPPMKKHE
jgi:hypothetical protein